MRAEETNAPARKHQDEARALSRLQKSVSIHHSTSEYHHHHQPLGNAYTMAEETTQTSLKITTGGWELEISVNMEKVPLKVYQETREERQTVCWIASEAGRVYHPSMCGFQQGLILL
jgi:hypothetical protein